MFHKTPGMSVLPVLAARSAGLLLAFGGPDRPGRPGADGDGDAAPDRHPRDR